MPRLAPDNDADDRAMRRSRFIACVYCAMALGAVCASAGVREWGGAVGLLEDTVASMSRGFAAIAVFNLLALSAIELLRRFLHDHAG